jgi:hypothetical protein
MYTLQGKTRSIRHTLFTLDLHRVPDPTSHVVHVRNISLVPTRMKHATTPGRSIGDRRQTDPAIILGHLIPPPSRQPWSRGDMFQPSGTFDTYSQVPTHRSLTDTGEGYRIKNLRITTSLSPPFPSECSTGPPNWPQPVSILSDIKHMFQDSSLKGLWPPHDLSTTRPSTVIYICA